MAWPRPFRCGTDSHLRLVQLAVSSWFSDLIVLDDLNPFDCRNLAAPVQGDLHPLPPSCYLLVIRRYHWRETGLMGLKNSTSAFLGKIALNYKQLLHDRDILPQRNKRLRSCWTDHLAGVRGIGVLLLFPLQELLGAFISSVPVAFQAEAVTMLRQGLSYSLFYKTSCIRVLHHHFRPCGASIRQKLTLLSPISEQVCLMELFSNPLMMPFAFRRISGLSIPSLFFCLYSSFSRWQLSVAWLLNRSSLCSEGSVQQTCIETLW